MIELIPTENKTYDINKFIKNKTNEENDCIICFNNSSIENEYFELECGHIFHSECISK